MDFYRKCNKCLQHSPDINVCACDTIQMYLMDDPLSITLHFITLFGNAVGTMQENNYVTEQLLCLNELITVLIHSFIHSGDLYSTSSTHYYSEAPPAQSRPKKKDLREMQNLEGWVISKERSSTGRSFHADGPTTEKALHCTVDKWARGTKSSPLAAERST